MAQIRSLWTTFLYCMFLASSMIRQIAAIFLSVRGLKSFAISRQRAPGSSQYISAHCSKAEGAVMEG